MARAHIRALIAVGATLAAAALSARAAPSQPNGRIVFQGNVGAGTQLFTIRADGSDLTQLTQFAENRARASGGQWSPNGKLIALNVETALYGTVDVMNASGSRRRRVCPKHYDFCGGDSAWMPNGRALVMPAVYSDSTAGTCDQGLRLVSLRGKLIRTIARVTTRACANDAADVQPAVSPNGKRVAFRASRGQAGAICVVGINGRGQRCLTPFADDDGWPAWSPDGSRLLFASDINDARGNITANLFTMRPDGSDVRQVTHLSGPGFYAAAGAWSPDGTTVVYRRQSLDGSDLYLIKPDGTNERQLTTLGPGFHAAGPDWGVNQG
jgi:Tol biopolymer transport system component